MKLRNLCMIACLLVVKTDCMTGPTGITAQVGPVGQPTDVQTTKILKAAMQVGNINTVKRILNAGFKPSYKFLIITIENTDSVEINRLVLQAADINDVRDAIPVILRSAIADWIPQRGSNVIQAILPYLSREDVSREDFFKIPSPLIQLMDQDIQDFIGWIKAGAPMNNLSDTDEVRFARIAFTMPAFTTEFKNLLNFLRKSDYNQVFTAAAIQDALILQNLSAIAELIGRSFKHNNTEILNRITQELKIYAERNNTSEGLALVDSLRKIINQESQKTKISQSQSILNTKFNNPTK